MIALAASTFIDFTDLHDMQNNEEPHFLDRLTTLLCDESISDVHLETDQAIWVRQTGELIKLDGPHVSSVDLSSWLQSRYKDASAEASVAALGGQDDFALNLGNFRVRGHAFISKGRLNVAVRRLASEIPALASLGLPASVQRLIEAPQGLVLVTGPTGSGKSTTLAAMIDWLNINTKSHIITLEDPIEYIHSDKSSRVRQRQIGEGADCVSFAAGGTSGMREDPDVLLIGEMRDIATVEAALNLAQTGHLVFATLHTNSGPETVNRILAFFAENERELARSVLSAVLRGVVSQRLVKTTSGGRTLAAEVLVATQAVRVHISGGKTNLIHQEMNSGATDGQLTLNNCLKKLVHDKIVDAETALMASLDRVALEKMLGVAS